VDLDRFKEINDSLGHDSGDAVLIELAYRILDELEVRDTIARLGGDEFGILIDDPTGIDALLGRIREVIGEELVVSDVPVMVEASIGYVFSDDGDDVDELLRRADVALYLAKEQHLASVRYD